MTYKDIKDDYEGNFIDNCITGHGIYHWDNGDSFEGTFLNGKMHGRGLYKWPDGGEYEGEYIHNIKEGKGRFNWSNGKIYKGEFQGGKPHGCGIMLIEKDKFNVEFADGKLVKSVIIKIVDVPKLPMDFKKDLKESNSLHDTSNNTNAITYKNKSHTSRSSNTNKKS